MSKTEHTPGTSTVNYSFGTFEIKISARGNIDCPDQLIDHMLTTATAALGVESLWRGISENHQNGKTREPCKTTTEIGEIDLTAEFTIDLKQHISKSQLNSIMFGVVIPRLWETAGIYLGKNQIQNNSSQPSAARSHLRALNGLDSALELQHPHDADHMSTNGVESREHVYAGHQQ